MEVNEFTFPNNVVITLKNELQKIAPPNPEDGDPGIPVFARPIKKGDPIQCIGVTAGMWLPDEDSYELGGMSGHSSPTVSNYVIGVQGYVQHMDEQIGLSMSATLSGAIRNTLIMSPSVRAALGALVSTEFGYAERFSRSRIQMQRFVSNEIQGQFMHLSSLELRVETQVNNL